MVRIRVLNIVCVLLCLLFLLLLGITIVMKINEWEDRSVVEKWLDLQSPDGTYTIIVRSKKPYSIFSSGPVDYELDVLVKKKGTPVPYGFTYYYFTTRLDAVEGGLDDDNYEIKWHDEGALLRFKNNRQSVSCIRDFEEFFKNRG